MWIAAIAVLVVLGALWIWMNYFQTYHLATVDTMRLYRDGFRSLREFRTAIADVNPKTVIPLIDADERKQSPFDEEDDFCRRSRIKIIGVPVKLGGWPAQADVKRFLEFAANPKYQPVLVHCAQGVRRTGMMVAAYQMSVLKWDKEKTKGAILTFGHSRRSIGDVEKFIDGYDPVTMATVTDLPVSAE
jgi:protein tyrosine/serine phosphatase